MSTTQEISFGGLGLAMYLESLHSITRPLFNRQHAYYLKRDWSGEDERVLRALWAQWCEGQFLQARALLRSLRN